MQSEAAKYVKCPDRALTVLSNVHKDHQMCHEIKPKWGKGGRSHNTSLSNVPPSLPSPSLPLLSARDMCTLSTSRHFQLGSADARTAASLPFPLFFTPLIILLSPLLHTASIHPPLYFPLPSLYPVILPRTFSPQADRKGRSCWRERACVISGCTWAKGELLIQPGKSTLQKRPAKGQTFISSGGEERGISQRQTKGVRHEQGLELGIGTQTMPGSVVLLLLSLLVLSTGSDARRIRKRGLNHKVRPLITFNSWLLDFTIGALLQLSHGEGSFVAEVRGAQVDLGQRPGCRLTHHPYTLNVL